MKYYVLYIIRLVFDILIKKYNAQKANHNITGVFLMYL